MKNISTKQKILMLALALLFVLISWDIHHEIQVYNPAYYHGKDNGAFVQFESICLFGMILFLLSGKGNKVLNALLGLVSAIITAISIYLLTDSGLLFPLISGLLLIFLFFAVEYLKSRIHPHVSKQGSDSIADNS